MTKIRILKICAVIVLLVIFFLIGKADYDKHHGNRAAPKGTSVTTSIK